LRIETDWGAVAAATLVSATGRNELFRALRSSSPASEIEEVFHGVEHLLVGKD
jgi:hypothetical protein